jgi:hypothetical protein
VTPWWPPPFAFYQRPPEKEKISNRASRRDQSGQVCLINVDDLLYRFVLTHDRSTKRRFECLRFRAYLGWIQCNIRFSHGRCSFAIHLPEGDRFHPFSLTKFAAYARAVMELGLRSAVDRTPTFACRLFRSRVFQEPS